LHHIAVRVHDFDAALRFYEEALGFTERLRWGEGNGRAVLLDVGGGDYFEVFAGGAVEPRGDGALLHVALRTTDCDAAIERVRAAGGQIVSEPKTGTTARIAFCRGPAGELIEFFQSDTV
jgi:glyoxylase I family protein